MITGQKLHAMRLAMLSWHQRQQATNEKIDILDFMKYFSLKDTNSESETHRMRENICKQCYWRGLNFKNVLTVPTTQQQKNQITQLKNGQKT